MGGPGSRLSTAHELLWRVALLVVSLGGGISGGSLDPGSLVSIISTSTCSSFAYSAKSIKPTVQVDRHLFIVYILIN